MDLAGILIFLAIGAIITATVSAIVLLYVVGLVDKA